MLVNKIAGYKARKSFFIIELPEYKVVGSQEADPMHRAISEDSPFGKALMGSKAGDQITVEAPRGVIHYRVDTIER